MELRHLRYFQAVAEDLSFSRAARRLRVAQPALSRAVKDLEGQMGVQLFERTRHFVRLTPAGAVLLREVGGLFEALEDSVGRVRRTAAGEEGELRLGYIGPPSRRFLGRALREYHARYPKVSVRLEERTPERVWEMVASGRLSAGITRPVMGQEPLGLQTLRLREERLGVVVRPDHPWAERTSVRWQALASEALAVLARREGMSLHDAILGACRKAGFAPRLAYTPSVIGTVLTYAEAGLAVGLVTDSVASGSTRLRFVPLLPRQEVSLVLVWQGDADTPAVRRFRELLMGWREEGRLWTPTAGELPCLPRG